MPALAAFSVYPPWRHSAACRHKRHYRFTGTGTISGMSEIAALLVFRYSTGRHFRNTGTARHFWYISTWPAFQGYWHFWYTSTWPALPEYRHCPAFIYLFPSLDNKRLCVFEILEVWEEYFNLNSPSGHQGILIHYSLGIWKIIEI